MYVWLNQWDFYGDALVFVKKVKPASFTDISGGVLQAIEFLNEKNPGKKTILIFSDMKEDLEKGYVRDLQFKLNGFEVIALNVTKLASDNRDPNQYLARLEQWQKRIEAGGGSWRITNDMDQLEDVFVNWSYSSQFGKNNLGTNPMLSLQCVMQAKYLKNSLCS